METLYYISLSINYLIFILLGYHFSNKITKPISFMILLLIIFVTAIAGWIKLGRIIDIFNFTIQFHWCLQGFGIGFIIGLLKNKYKNKIRTV